MVFIVPHGSMGNINICSHSPGPLFCCLSAQGNRGIMHMYLDVSPRETLKEDIGLIIYLKPIVESRS